MWILLFLFKKEDFESCYVCRIEGACLDSFFVVDKIEYSNYSIAFAHLSSNY